MKKSIQQARAKGLPVRVRSALKVASFFGVCAGAVGIVWGWNPIATLLVLAAAFFVLAAGLEMLAAKRKIVVRARDNPAPIVTPIGPVRNGFRRVESEGTIWREKTVQMCGRHVVMKLRDEDSAFEAALPSADAVVENAENIGRLWLDYRAECANDRRFSESRDEIAALEIEAFEFFAPTRPNTAEVILVGSADRTLWTCLYADGRFSDLSTE